MKWLLFFLATVTLLEVSAQSKFSKQTDPIVEEGKLLYRCEMASWYGTDLFLEAYPNRGNIGGYFSYVDGDLARCVFFSKADNHGVIGTITFDVTYDLATADVNLQERDFSAKEHDLYEMRRNALDLMGTDTLFKVYENTNLNLIPLISQGEKKVYVLTGPQKNGVVVLGNDYLLTMRNNNTVKRREKLHNNIISIPYGDSDQEIMGTMHTHNKETGPFITPTDICTLMLYAKFAGWKTHSVVSADYLNLWNCETNSLLVLTKDAVEKINTHQKSTKDGN
ncbi:hypothetical protein [Lewinella sp. LCG006]|uniref:hypothetical protein n=1 Tax=Lewinella sp. LCG006 TaxID=3231911 RepID=UPI00345FA5B7